MKLNEAQLARLRSYLERLALLEQRATALFLKLTARDGQLILCIFILAFVLRIPFIDHPNQTQFDEVIYANYTLHVMHGMPFFDIHPPLARMIFSSIAEQNSPTTIWYILYSVDGLMRYPDFADFPYVPIRLFVSLMGVLLPLLVYTIGRTMGYSPRQALLPAFFVTIDNAFIVYSRTMLPDTLLVLFNMLAFGGAIIVMRSARARSAILYTITIGISIGLALSLKWTALAVLGLIVLMLARTRRFLSVFAILLIAMVIYAMVFATFFLNFPQGGMVDPILKDPLWVRTTILPQFPSFQSALQYIPEWNSLMLRENKDEELIKTALQAPGPLSWPVSRSQIPFWKGENDEVIILQGNAMLWVTSFFVVIFELLWISGRLIQRARALGRKAFVGRSFPAALRSIWPIDENETILLLGYFMNYLPFFLIERPMYLYHYFTSFVFLLFLIPSVYPRILHCVATLSRDQLFAKFLSVAVVLLIVINFILDLPTIYGF